MPDFRGRFPIAKTGISEDEFENQGKTAGAKKHKLTVAELAQHDHDYVGYTGGSLTPFSYQPGETPGFLYGGGVPAPMTTATAGSDEEHNTLPPYLVLSTAQIKY